MSVSSSIEIEAMLVWFSSQTDLIERGRYTIRHTTNEVKCLLKEMKYKVDINTLHKVENDRNVGLNDIARVSLQTSAPIYFDFILIMLAIYNVGYKLALFGF